MLHRTRTWIFFVLTMSVVCFSISVVFAQEAKPEAVGLRPDAPTYALHGPYWVGYKPLVIGEGANKLEAGIWYPALNPKGDKEQVTYPTPVGEFHGHALLNAAVDSSKRPYPLVVFSHGTGGTGNGYGTIIEHFASYGFVVIAPNHNDQQDPNSWAVAEIDRPRQDIQVLDYAEKITAASGDMAGMIDMSRVAAAGHSQGGSTALTMGGAQFDMDALAARCAKLSKDDPVYPFTCGGLLGFEADMAARADLKSVPKGLWPPLGDARIKAVVTMAGDSYMFDKDGQSKVTIPVMALGGTIDVATPYEWGAKPTYEQVSSAQKALVTFENADHPIFMELCENASFNPDFDKGFYQWMCYQPVWDRKRAMDLVLHFSTAFLLDILKGDKDAASALKPDAVSFPGIQYEAQGF